MDQREWGTVEAWAINWKGGVEVVVVDDLG